MWVYQNDHMMLGSEKYVPTVCFSRILIHPQFCCALNKECTNSRPTQLL